MISPLAARYALERITDALEESDALGYLAAEVDVLERLVEEREKAETAAAIAAGFIKPQEVPEDDGICRG